MKYLRFSLLLVLGLLIFTPPDASALDLRKVDKNLVLLQDGKLKKAKHIDLSSKKYVAFYYSAHWCPPCRKFTPKLVEFYREMKQKHGKDFELVFVSKDQSQQKMIEYMQWGKMTWPAMEYKKVIDRDVDDLAASGIPYLVVVDHNGKEVLGKGNAEWVYPGKLLPQLEKLLE